jgi:hypothetical protein
MVVGLGAGSGVTVGVFSAGLAGLVGLAKVLAPGMAPPRFLKWTGETEVDLDEFGMGAQATFYAPMKRALARAKAQMGRMALATAAGAGVGAGLGFAMGMSPVGLALLGGLVTLAGYVAVVSMVEGAREVAGSVRDVKKDWEDPYANPDAKEDKSRDGEA